MQASVRDMQALPLAAGALAGALSATLSSGVAALMCALAGLLLISLSGRRRWFVIFMIGFAAVCISAMMLRPEAMPKGFFDGSERSFVAEAVDVRDSPDGQRIVADVGTEEYPSFRAILYTSDISAPIAVGDIFAAQAVFVRNGRMAEVQYLRLHGLYGLSNRAVATATVEPSDIELRGHNPTSRSFFAALRDKVALGVYSSALAPATASLLVASLLGTSDAPPELRESFRAGGLAHLLCVSGFHVGVVAALFSLLFRPLRLLRRGREVSYVLLIAVVWLYAALTGLMPSAIRATIMLSCFFAVKLMQRKYSQANTLAFAVAIMLVVNPYWIYSPGFMLSVSAVGGMLVFARRLNPVPQGYVCAHRLASVFVVPLAAMLGTAPFVLALFHRLPLLSVPVNAFAAMLFPLFMLVGGIYALLSLFGLECPFLAGIAERLHGEISLMCDFGAAFEMTDIYLSSATFAAVVLAIALCATLLHLSSMRHKVTAAVAMVVCVCFAACGDSVPSGRHLLIDGNVYSSEIYVIDEDSARIYSTGRRERNLGMYTDFFGGRGLGDADIHHLKLTDGGSVRCGDKTILYAGKEVPAASTKAHVDYLLVDRRFKGDYAALLDRINPSGLVIGAGIPTSRLEQLYNIAMSREVPCISLADRPVYLSDF